MPPLTYSLPCILGFPWKPAFIDFIFSLLKCRASLSISSFIWAVMGAKVSSLCAAAAIGAEDVQKLPLAMVVCCNPPDIPTTDSYIAIYIFLFLSTVLEENAQELRSRHIISLFLFSLVCWIEQQNTCMWALKMALKDWRNHNCSSSHSNKKDIHAKLTQGGRCAPLKSLHNLR